MIDTHTFNVTPQGFNKSPANPLPEITSRYSKDEPTTYPGTSIKSYDGEKTLTLEIHKLTDKAMEISLTIPRTDIVQQRKLRGFAITEEVHQITLNFNELVNRIFCIEHDVFYQEEAFPDSVKEAMKRAYDK
jgi:hypothetical protein